MARGQDAPTQQGYQIDPYVQQSLATSKQQAGNRVVTAMEQAGAAQRQKSAQTAAFVQQGQTQQFETQQQAARMAQEDKRVAENEVARREEMEYRKTVDAQTQAYQNAMVALAQKQEERLAKGEEWEREDKERQDALNKLRDIRDMRIEEGQTNVQLSMLEYADDRETKAEQAVTAAMEGQTRYTEQKNMHDFTSAETLRKIKLDSRWGLPVSLAEVTEPLTTAGKIKTSVFGGAKTFATTGLSVFGDIKKEKEALNPLDIIQDQLTNGNTGLSVGDLLPTRGYRLKSALEEGKVSEVEVANADAVLKGSMQALQEKIDGSKSEREKKALTIMMGRISGMKDALYLLKDDTTKIKGKDTKTIGMVIREGLAPGNPNFAPTFNAQAWRAKNAGLTMKEFIDQSKKGIDPVANLTFPVEPLDDPATVWAKNYMNEIVYGTYPQYKPAEELPED
jgi:hypothetical protein